MTKRNKKKRTVNKDAWLATYGDMITLVLTFFVLLYSMSSISAEKWEIVLEAFSTNSNPKQIVLDEINNELNELPGSASDKEGLGEEIKPEEIKDMDDLYQYLKQYVANNQLETSVEVGKGEGFVIMRFRDSVFFTPNSPILQPTGKGILDYLVAGMEPIEEGIELVRVDGHTATVPNQSHYTISDRRLSSDRANSVLMYMEAKDVVQPDKLIAVGYGKHRPIASNDTPEEREKNRRVEIYITEKSDTDINEIYEALAPKEVNVEISNQ